MAESQAGQQTSVVAHTERRGNESAQGDGGGWPFRSYVVSWNLTYRCNLACAHCYLDAGGVRNSERGGELSTAACFRTVEQIHEVTPGALLILSGGEPLLRPDLFDIAAYAAARGLVVVLGTNGTLLTAAVARRLVESGVRGVGISVDSLDPGRHDAFRYRCRAWAHSVAALGALRSVNLPFLVQTTVMEENYDEVPAIVEWAAARGARFLNLYFLVPTGRGAYLSTVSPEQYEALLQRLPALQARHAGRLVISAKCAPHYQRVLFEHNTQTPALRTYLGAGGCPAATQYCGIRPTGDVVPCPYLPVTAGSLHRQTFGEIWRESPVMQRLRQRALLGGRCGPCEFRALCGGCRARAYGATGDYLAEDPWCVYQPGRYGGGKLDVPPEPTYGVPPEFTLTWTPEARARAAAIPAFVRGMVVRAVERYAHVHGHAEVTPVLMAEARARLVGHRPSLPPLALPTGGQPPDRGPSHGHTSPAADRDGA
ncbi:MAG: radical SAM protein [Chloroflexi bacterium]|nr:radical SAM protein [Chloroflexota bacterium]